MINREKNINMNPIDEYSSDEFCSNFDIIHENTDSFKTSIIKKFENNQAIEFEKIYFYIFGELNENIYYIDCISDILEDLINSNLGKINIITIFNSSKVPSLSIKNYLRRFYKFSKASLESYILSLIYLDRLSEKYNEFFLNEVNSHKLILTAFSLASKYNDDLRLKNTDIGKIGGVRALDLNNMEIELLNLLEYNLSVNNQEFFSYLSELFLNNKSN